MYYTREYLNRAHREIDTIFRVLFPEHGMAVREEQIMLCHKMLDNLLGRNIALCDAGVGIGKTYAYLVACVLMRKYSLLAEGCSPYEQRPVVISTSSIALQKAILTEYIPFLSRILQENGTIQAPIKGRSVYLQHGSHLNIQQQVREWYLKQIQVEKHLTY